MADKKNEKDTKKNNVNKDQNIKNNNSKKDASEDKSNKNIKDVQSEANELKNQVNELKKQVNSLNDKYLRAEAETQNVQNHAKQDQADLLKYSGQNLAKSILPGLDNLERAMSVEVSDDSGKQLKQGVKMVYDRLKNALKENNITEIDAINKEFDPQFFQAVQTVPADDDHPSDQVVKVLQKGFKINDRILRPAMVVVAK